MEPTPSVEQQFLKKLIDIIDANLHNEQFGVNELATELGMSRITLHRKVKSVVKKSVSEFIRETRLKRGYELLQQKAGTVSEIAYEVGFGSVTYFNRCFHDQFGFPPGEVLKGMHPDVEKSPVKNKQSLIQKLQKSKILYIIPIVVLLVVVIFQFLKNQDLNAQVDKSIAVLPFLYLSNDTTNQYLANGMMEDILLNLSKIKDLRVISRTSVEQYRKSDKTVSTIGRELNVAYVLEASFQKVDNQMRLIVHLFRTKDEDRVWSNNYDRNWEDIFSVQSEVAEAVAGELQAVVSPEEKQLIRKVPTINLTAYDFYQKGNEEYNNYLFEGSGDISRILNAERYFLKALELDSTFALVYSGMAMTYYYKNLRKNFFSDNYMDTMLFLANKALSLDNQLAEAKRIKGNYFYEKGDPEKARIEYEKVLKLNPNDWRAYANLGIICKTLDDYVSSINYLDKAMIRNRGPELGYLLSSLGAAYQNAGFIENAKKCYKEKLALNNDSVEYGFHNVWLEYEIGNYEAAYTIENNTFSFNPNFVGTLTLSILAGHNDESYSRAVKKIDWIKKNGGFPLVDSHRIGFALLKEGKKDEAKYYFDKQIEYGLESIKLGRTSSADKTAHYDLAAAYAIIGEKENAYQHLNELNKKKTHPLFGINLIKNDPLFDSIRNEPRFQAIVKNMEAKYKAEHDRVGKWLAEQGML